MFNRSAIWFLRNPMLLLLFSCTGQFLNAQCAAPYKIDWPAANPVWSMCWVPPNSSSGINGSGLELRHVFYKGKRVFWQANVPVLNVKYDPGGCGGGSLSYRDWQNELVAFAANNVVQPGYAEPTSPPTSVCDHPGSDAGSFAGVAVEKKPDRLILTTQMRAGWYRYIQKWTFYVDGTIEPRFGFSAVNNPCTSKAHSHHLYWRFDFDINGFPNDLIQEFNSPPPNWHNKNPEIKRLNAAPQRKWRVIDKPTGLGYEVLPSSANIPAGSWGVADMWALRYHGNETDDGGATAGPTGDAEHIEKYINGENTDGQDVVMWYRAGYRHSTGPTCQLVGPTLKPFGPW